MSIMGLVATSKRSPCLLLLYALLLLLAFFVLIAGVASSVRIIFIIFHGIDNYVSSLALPLVKRYGNDSFATTTWDSLHSALRVWLSSDVARISPFFQVPTAAAGQRPPLT